MDKAKLKAEFSQLLDEIELLEQTAGGFYDYEQEFVKLHLEMGAKILEESIGTSTNYRKKKDSDHPWQSRTKE